MNHLNFPLMLVQYYYYFSYCFPVISQGTNVFEITLAHGNHHHAQLMK